MLFIRFILFSIYAAHRCVCCTNHISLWTLTASVKLASCIIT